MPQGQFPFLSQLRGAGSDGGWRTATRTPGAKRAICTGGGVPQQMESAIVRSKSPAGTLGAMEARFIPRTPLGRRLVEHREAVVNAASRRHASNVRVFGSVARGEDGADSDIDLLVDIDPSVTAFDLLELGCDLEDELHVHVDVGTPSSLRPFLRADVLAEALAL